MVPNCRDKSDLYRAKMPFTMTQMFPSLTRTRQRRPSHNTKRHRPRTSLAYRGTSKGSIHSTSLRQRKQRTHLDMKARQSIVSDDRWRRTGQKKRQKKSDGNPSKSIHSMSNRTYVEIESFDPPNNDDDDDEERESAFESPTPSDRTVREQDWTPVPEDSPTSEANDYESKVPISACSSSLHSSFRLKPARSSTKTSSLTRPSKTFSSDDVPHRK